MGSLNPESNTFESDVDYCDDVNRYGRAYAKYKAKLRKDLEDDEDEEYESDISDYGNDCESD